MILIASAAALLHAQNASPASGAVYYGRLDYILTTTTETSLMLSENQVVEVSAPPAPSGYNLYFLRVSFPKGLPDGVVPVKYDRAEVMDNKIVALISYTGSVKLAGANSNATVSAEVTVCYIKTAWLKLEGGAVNFTVEDPPPPFTKNDLVVKFTVENHAPFAVTVLKGPNGESLLGSGEPSPDAIKVDYKHVELNFKYLDLGTYTVELKQGSEYVLPSSFLVYEPPFKEDTVAPGQAKRYGIGQMNGWKGIGAVVILYSISPLSGRGSGEADVAGELVDFAYYKNEIVTIRAASFLIPNINLRVYIKAYIVYGTWFEIRNNMKSTVNVMYTTVFIKESGEWQPTGVQFTVRENEIKDAMAAYIVVQAPNYGRVVGVKTPSGAELGATQEGLLPWGDEYRDVRVFMSEAYIQVKAFGVSEPGTYFFRIDWKPISFKAVDDGGEPIVGATVSISGPLNASTLSNEFGLATFKLYKPGAYTVNVQFKGINVATLQLGTITNDTITVKCKVYRVSWLVVDAWDKPLSGVEIVVRNGDSLIERVATGESGITPAVQIPAGQFVVQATYKRVTSSRVETFDSSGVRKLKLDVLFEIPLFGGIPVTTLETAFAGAAVGGGTLAAALVKRSRASPVEEVAIEE